MQVLVRINQYFNQYLTDTYQYLTDTIINTYRYLTDTCRYLANTEMLNCI